MNHTLWSYLHQRSYRLGGGLYIKELPEDCDHQMANDLHLESPSLLGRWKVTGIRESIGLEGALAFSTSQRWTPVEILYISNQQMVFLADNLGNAGPMQYLYCGTPRQIKFKAVKSHARTLQKQASEQATASASAARPKMISSADRQKEFYAKVHKSVPAPKIISSKRTWAGKFWPFFVSTSMCGM